MYRLLLFVFLSVLLAAPQATAQKRHRAPPARGHKKHKDKHKGKGKGHDKHRAPPAPEPDMPVRKPLELGKVHPDGGPPGTVVEIRGRHFDDTVKVRFNGRWLRIQHRTDHMVRVRIPRNAATDRFVVSKAGFPDQTTDAEFTVLRKPVISGFAPRRGGAGTRVVVRGQHFIPGDTFMVGQVEVPVEKRRHDRVVIRIVDGVRSARILVKRDGKVLARSGHPFDVEAPPPVVDGFSPKRGGPGTLVRINGQNFEPTDWVELAGRRLPIRGRGPGHIMVMIGRNRTGHFMVRGRAGRRARAGEPFVVIRPPRIAGFTPRYGPPGTRITVEGSGFIDGDAVLIGDAVLTVRTVSDGRIVAELPAGVQSGPVFVKRGPHKHRARGRFEVVHAPVITDFDPREAPVGARVEVRGRHFSPDASVLLAGRRLRIVARELPHTLAVQIPPGARTGQLVVVTRGGSARAAVPFRVSQYAALASIFPLHGLPGTKLTLRGDHFHKGIQVLIGKVELPVVHVEPTRAVVRVTEEARSGRVAVVSHGRRMVSNLHFTVDVPKPAIEFSFAPTSGRRGTEVTLHVRPPHPVTVFFDGRPLPKKVLMGGRRIVVTIPGDARSGYFELEYEGKRYRAAQRFRVR